MDKKGYLRGFFSSVSDLFVPKENPELLFSSDFSSDLSTGLLSDSALLDPNENPVFEASEEEDPKENPDFSSDFVDSDPADPKANPVEVPNLTGSVEAFGLESSELLPKTAPKKNKKNCISNLL